MRFPPVLLIVFSNKSLLTPSLILGLHKAAWEGVQLVNDDNSGYNIMQTMCLKNVCKVSVCKFFWLYGYVGFVGHHERSVMCRLMTLVGNVTIFYR
jgi:hypothetical protein